MKTINVVAAIIHNNGLYFATQRGYGEFKDMWEFPGGKIENNETPENALKREIFEELDTDISVDRFFCNVEYDYPQFHLSMKCFLCSVVSGNLLLKEHENSAWVTKEKLEGLNWLMADRIVVEQILKE